MPLPRNTAGELEELQQLVTEAVDVLDANPNKTLVDELALRKLNQVRARLLALSIAIAIAA